MTEKQRKYIRDLVADAGWPSVGAAMEAVAEAGRVRYPNNASAVIMRAYDAGRITPEDLTVAEGAKLISVLLHAESYGVSSPRFPADPSRETVRRRDD